MYNQQQTRITLNNKDATCVWFSWLASSTIGTRTTKVNDYDKPNAIAKAK